VLLKMPTIRQWDNHYTLIELALPAHRVLFPLRIEMNQVIRPMQLATTLVHQGAMPIAVHAVSTFSRHFSATHRLDIHTDGSVDKFNQQILIRAAGNIEVRIVTPEDRKTSLTARLRHYPRTRELIARGAYFTKLELPIVADGPYFYFDSDIVWLRHVPSLTPTDHPNAFSTESWSWYYGINNDRHWIKEKTPRRVNSGFYYVGEPFPHDRMEDLLQRKMFDPDLPHNTDQEIMAYLFRDMAMYHPEDLKRSRVGIQYKFEEETCAALHFPGKMWISHMEKIKHLCESAEKTDAGIRFLEPVPLSHAELLRMRSYIALANSNLTQGPLSLYRWLRGLR